MTVGELKAVLDDYADHVDVIVSIEQRDTTRRVDFDIDYSSNHGDLEITVELP